MPSDPAEIRETVEGLYAGWAAETLDPTWPPFSVAGAAESLVDAAVMCLIAGKDMWARRLLGKAEAWLDSAFKRVRRGESWADIEYEVAANVDLALCRWLAESPTGPPDLSRACARLKDFLGGLSPRKARAEWSWALPILLTGGEAAFCVQEFEGQYRRFSMATIDRQGQAGMAYLLARQQLEPVLSPGDLAAVVRDFLDQFVGQWLDGGRYNLCAMWVKLLVPPKRGERPGKLLRRGVLEHVG